MRLSSNKNTYWAKIFVDELVQCGLQKVCIAAGSRSTPLTLAFAENKEVKSYSHVDERSAGFFALGLAMSSRKPVALVCTSGTAAANFHPAILEAWYARIPLLILTADRPHHLRSFGANQTMDQIKLYGTHVKWFVDVAPPRENPSEEDIKYLQTLACRVYAESQFLPSGPVHLNFPFSKPLEPSSKNAEERTGNEVNETSIKITQGKLQGTKQQINEIFRNWGILFLLMDYLVLDSHLWKRICYLQDMIPFSNKWIPFPNQISSYNLDPFQLHQIFKSFWLDVTDSELP
jgi:2-succinyl-5-enolpyruvyl-6-hydroxy-3-cyclohexene-1-carboxylate synthase